MRILALTVYIGLFAPCVVSGLANEDSTLQERADVSAREETRLRGPATSSRLGPSDASGAVAVSPDPRAATQTPTFGAGPLLPSVRRAKSTEFTGDVQGNAGHPLPGATVILRPLDSSSAAPAPVVTDAQGRFAIVDVRTGRYDLVFMAPRYRSRVLGTFGVDAASRHVVMRNVGLGATRGLPDALTHLGVPAWLAALVVMAAGLALMRLVLPRPPPSGVQRVARKRVALAVGLVVGPAAAMLICAVVWIVSTAGPELPDGVLPWARYSGYGAIGFAGFGVAPVIVLVSSINARVATAPVQAAILAACAGLAAGMSMCRSLTTAGLGHYLGFAGVDIAYPGFGGPLNLARSHMQVVCVASAVVVGVTGLAASWALRRLSDRRSATEP